MALPTEMTPERALQLGNRWRWAGFAAIAATVVLLKLGTSPAVYGIVAAAVCLTQQTDHYSWRCGYLARERKETLAQLRPQPAPECDRTVTG